MATFTKTEVKMVVIPLTIMILLSVVSLGFGAGSIDQLLNGSSELETEQPVTQDEVLAVKDVVDEAYEEFSFPVPIWDKGYVVDFIEKRLKNKPTISEKYPEKEISALSFDLMIEMNEQNTELNESQIGEILSKRETKQDLSALNQFGFDLSNSNNLMIGIFITMIALGLVSAIKVFGSSFDIPNYVISLGAYLLIWGLVSYVSLEFFTEIPIFGGLIYFGLTLMYVLGVLMTTEIL